MERRLLVDGDRDLVYNQMMVSSNEGTYDEKSWWKNPASHLFCIKPYEE